jgi:hypothetical protein
MWFTRQTRIRAFAFGGALLAAFAVVPQSAVRADAVQDQVDAMKGFEKAGDDGKCIAKMQEMKDSFGDTRVLKAIKDMTGSKNDKIACAAVKMMAARKDPKDVEWLKSVCDKIGDKDNFKDKDKGGNPDLMCAYLDAVVMFKADKGSQATIKAALPKFFDVVKHHLSTNAEFSMRAIRAYGCVRDRFVMDQLLEWGEGIEARSGKSGAGGGGGSKKGASTETRDIEGKSKKVILETLADITQKDGGSDIQTWKKWWAEHEKGFVFPEAGDPDAPAPAAVGPTIPPGAEFKDDAFGYSMKRPEADGWTWVKADFDGPRVGLNYSAPEDPKYLIARAYVSIYNTAKVPPKDVKGMTDWVLTKPIKEQMDTHDKAPTVTEQKFGGAEWTVVDARGDGIGVKSGWGTIERRFYLVKFDTYMLWVDAFVRTGAEEDVKAALWKSIETITLPAPKK